jgi:hypothetical protein
MMGLSLLVAAWIHTAIGQSQWRILYPDGRVAAGWGGLPAAPAAQSQPAARSIWAWSWLHAPIEIPPSGAPRIPRRFADDGPFWLEVRLSRGARPALPSGTRLVAAPIEMWREIPEDALPTWPVPASGHFSVPVDRAHAWRLRLVAEGEGSWWLDVPPRQRSVVVAAVAARGLDVTVIEPDGKPAVDVHARVGEATVRREVNRTWALLQGPAGRLTAAGLPDEQDIALSLFKAGFPPLVVRGWTSRLPRRVVLVRGGAVVGRVTDREHRPIGGASAEVEAWGFQPLPQLLRLRAVSKPDGTFELRGLPRGRLGLTLRAPGYVPGVEQLDVAAGETRDLGTRVLDLGRLLQVEVVDEAGRPVPGAEVQAGPGLSVTADAAGHARFASLPSAPLQITGTAPGYQPGSRRLQPPFPEPAVLKLRHGFSVRGRLLDGSGAPVAEGSLRIEAASCTSEGSLHADGLFEEDFPPGKEAQLVLRSPATRELRVPLAAGKTGEMRDLGDLSAPAGPEITGKVASGRDGEPIMGARLWLPRPGPKGAAMAWGSRDLVEARSGEDGRFRLSGLAAGPATLRIEATGYARFMVDLVLPDVPEGGSATDVGTLTLSGGTLVRVHVDPSRLGIDASADMVARVDLRRRWLDADMLSAQVWNGQAEVPNVPASAALVSVAAGPRIVCQKQVDVAGDGGELDVDCAKGALLVAGQVLVGGTPAGAGLLSWQWPGDQGYARIDNQVSPTGLRQQQVFGAGRPQVDVQVGADGRFQTQDLTPGAWRVFFQPGQGSATPALGIEIPPGDRFDTVLPFAGSNVTGVVVTKDGSPAAGARVSELGSGALAFAKANGTFSLTGLSPGRIALQARLEDLSSNVARVDLAADAPPDPVRLTLGKREPTQIAVTVLDRSGAPAVGAMVFFEEEGKGMRLLVTGTDGSASAGLEAPLAPRVRAGAFANGGFAFGEWASLEQAQQGLALQPAATGGMVVRSAKRQGAVRVMSQSGWDVSWMMRLLGASTEITVERPLRLDGLPAGSYTVSLGGATSTVGIAAGSVGEGRVD